MIQSKIGISTGSLKNKYDWEDLLLYSPDFIEFYNFPQTDIVKIENFCNVNNVEVSIHTPLPYDDSGHLRRFCPSGPDTQSQQDAIRLTKNTILCASFLKALHVVVHFPSPYPKPEHVVTKEIIKAFWDPVLDFAAKCGTSIVVENMTTHKSFNAAQHYFEMFKDYPDLKLCFDIGHAWMKDGNYAVDQFIELLHPQISACHIYGLQRTKENQFIRQPVHHLFLSEESGYMPLDKTISHLISLGVTANYVIESPALSRAEHLHFCNSPMIKKWRHSGL